MNSELGSQLWGNWVAARYRFQFKVTTPIALPGYAGSTIRGVFGRALRRLSCITHESDCKHCPLYRSCVYTNLFETPAPEEHSLQKFSQVPNPFIIEAPICQVRFYQPGDCLTFSVVLIGHAIRQLPLVIFALKKGFEYNIAHGTAMLQKVDHINTKGKAICIYHAEDRSIVEHETFITCPSFSHVDEINLRFETHLRLQKNGVVLGAKEINPHAFLNALVRRIALLSEFHMKKPLSLDFSKLSALAETVQWEKDFQWRDWQRYSSRQKRTMHLGGLLGQCRFKKLPSEFLPFLYLGQWFHMGKNATFGLGKFQIGVKSDEK